MIQCLAERMFATIHCQKNKHPAAQEASSAIAAQLTRIYIDSPYRLSVTLINQKMPPVFNLKLHAGHHYSSLSQTLEPTGSLLITKLRQILGFFEVNTGSNCSIQ